MTEGVYHRALRSALLVMAFVTVFDSGLVSPLTKQLSDNTILYLAQSAGVYAQIAPNEYNTITAELTRRETELAAREAELRDIEARDFGNSRPDYSTYVLASILFILTVLITLNYVLDWRRARMSPVPV
jgi:hypothetical protein